ncbi:hypothetical protein [Arachidicoccus terrestris]|uniref:hypothetical protein n=1 Tax=Arachidicoccus terrestris TaxID=2875539 RepID=UPI001CC77594|nr:hypothetical protein [Arachidicoccus terrestris]UAY54105.1 hypothetical protein K9M52_11565 [Arachidicoccus terrestris]
MFKNLSIEWLKLKNYRTFWWLMGLFALCLIGSNYITYQLKVVTSAQSHGGLDLLIGNPFGFPDVWQSVAYVSSYVLFLPGFLMVILITNEYNFKTHRQNIIDGMRRSEFALTKILLAVCLSVLSTILVFIIASVTGLISGSSFSLTGAVYILYFLLQALTYTLGGLLLGTLLKRSGLSIAIYLIYIGFIKNLIAFLADRYLGGIGSYTPVKSADNLIPLPFFKQVTKQLMTPPDLTWLLIMTVLYLTAFYWLTLQKYKMQDL